MASKTKEQQQQELENKRKLREKQRLQLKASNEMLEEAKQRVIEKYGEGSDSANEYIAQLTTAQDQNIERAQEILNVSEEEFYSGNYNEVNPKEAEAYYKRLETLGKSDELLHMKDVSEQLKMYEENKNSNTAVPTVKKTKTRLSELTEKLKQLQSVPAENNEKANKPDVVETATVINNTTNDNNSKEELKPVVNEVKPKQIKYDIQGTSATFDPRDVPSYVQYDMIPLPSKGQCYKNKMEYIPVAYLTAADENLISSRNLYESGSMIDLILERKILDKSIRVSDLCKGDRDAIAIWLRATAYGPDYPIIAPYKGEEIEATINLNDIHYVDFELKGDENGWFDYKLDNGDILKFKVLTSGDEANFSKNISATSEIINRAEVVANMNNSLAIIESIESDEKDDIIEAIKLVTEWARNFRGDADELINKMYMTYVTDRLCLHTMAVNGNTDREYIKNYVENMLAKDAQSYRKYIASHIPGVNLNITIPVPESMGGGSFETFLSIGETIFANV